VHGYYLEAGKAHAGKVPTHYTRRQTLANAERYITEELKAFEDKVLSARERSLAREKQLYEELVERSPAARAAEGLRRGAERTRRAGLLRRTRGAAGLDAAGTVGGAGIRIERGRHPVVEAVRDEPFEPNDLVLGDEPVSWTAAKRSRRGGCW
jgi:DNA mismatch repair protein MutS